MPALFWHRRDLRVADNVGLAETADPVVPVFVLDDVLAAAGPPRVAFLAAALDAFERARGGVSAALRRRGVVWCASVRLLNV